MSIVMRRPLVEMHSRLRDIPADWLRLIEPKIVRGSFLPCWIWCGTVDRNGYPMLKSPVNGRMVMAHRFVAAMFWDFPPEYFIGRTCQNLGCLNPRHLVPQPEHPRWAPPGAAL